MTAAHGASGHVSVPGVRPRARSEEERHYYALNARVWRVLAPFYDTMVLPLRPLRHRVARQAAVGPGMRVLDVATGTGAQALAFARAGAEVVGVDLSESMLRIARRNAHDQNVAFQVADARELPFEDEHFDVSCVSFALHEMPPSVRQGALREMARVTRRNGKIVIVDYALPRGRLTSALVFHLVKLYERDHFAEFVRSDLQAMLTRAGLVARTDGAMAPGWIPAMILIAVRSER